MGQSLSKAVFLTAAVAVPGYATFKLLREPEVAGSAPDVAAQAAKQRRVLQYWVLLAALQCAQFVGDRSLHHIPVVSGLYSLAKIAALAAAIQHHTGGPTQLYAWLHSVLARNEAKIDEASQRALAYGIARIAEGREALRRFAAEHGSAAARAAMRATDAAVKYTAQITHEASSAGAAAGAGGERRDQ
mmetsp:Transcript_82001/g.198771  ORF Transcript_82001/g.198771 Transcript_82001/m.198771 type:complete len:188 (+) Transcript_82001:132-695(+)